MMFSLFQIRGQLIASRYCSCQTNVPCQCQIFAVWFHCNNFMHYKCLKLMCTASVWTDCCGRPRLWLRGITRCERIHPRPAGCSGGYAGWRFCQCVRWCRWKMSKRSCQAVWWQNSLSWKRYCPSKQTRHFCDKDQIKVCLCWITAVMVLPAVICIALAVNLDVYCIFQWS